MTQLELITEKQNGLTVFGEYVAAFSDGTVSEILTPGTVPHDSEGPYLPIFQNDDELEIIGKLGMLLHAKH